MLTVASGGTLLLRWDALHPGLERGGLLGAYVVLVIVGFLFSDRPTIAGRLEGTWLGRGERRRFSWLRGLVHAAIIWLAVKLIHDVVIGDFGVSLAQATVPFAVAPGLYFVAQAIGAGTMGPKPRRPGA